MKMYDGWDKNLESELISIDVRRGDFSYHSAYGWDKNRIGPDIVIIKPTIQADMRFLPFHDNCFDAVVFDPPHTNAGLGSWIWKRFGGWSQTEKIRTSRVANEEFKRVLKRNGFLIMKTYRSDWPIYRALFTNFTFFLPIERRTGAFNKKSTRKILWAIGQLNGDIN